MNIGGKIFFFAVAGFADDLMRINMTATAIHTAIIERNYDHHIKSFLYSLKVSLCIICSIDEKKKPFAATVKTISKPVNPPNNDENIMIIHV